ncbi:MAG: hypothetical protein WC505_02235 [Patescibacteria group bacterium]
MDVEGLQYEAQMTWQDVFERWKSREGVRSDWQQVARDKGWDSWEEWRSHWVANFGAQERTWVRYAIPDPVKTVPQFRIGPSRSWQKFFPETERNRHTFATLVERAPLARNGKVQALKEHFPEPTEFIGVYVPDKRIVLIEGHHRAAALGLLAQQGKRVLFVQLPTIAVTVFNPGEAEILDQMLERGSEKKNYL